MTVPTRARPKDLVPLSHHRSLDAVPGGFLGDPRVITVRISDLHDADSPRSSGVDIAHAHVLAQVEGPLPPIMVHHPTMRIIDGMHRVAAAKLRGGPRSTPSSFPEASKKPSASASAPTWHTAYH
ncbi:hypothetical protein ACFQ9X_08960 [Catenulispora yoronensis]